MEGNVTPTCETTTSKLTSSNQMQRYGGAGCCLHTQYEHCGSVVSAVSICLHATHTHTYVCVCI